MPVDCWIDVQSQQTEVKDHPASLRVICGQHIEFPAVVGFVDWNYCYKIEATQISYGAGLATFPLVTLVKKFFPQWGSRVRC